MTIITNYKYRWHTTDKIKGCTKAFNQRAHIYCICKKR